MWQLAGFWTNIDLECVLEAFLKTLILNEGFSSSSTKEKTVLKLLKLTGNLSCGLCKIEMTKLKI